MYLKPVKEYCIQLNIFHVVFGQCLLHTEGQHSQSLKLPLLEDELVRNTAHLSLLRMKHWGNCLSSAAGLKSDLWTGSTDKTGGINADPRTTVHCLQVWQFTKESSIPYEMPQTCNEQNQPYTISVAFSTERKTDGLALFHIGQQLSYYDPTSWIGGQTYLKKKQILTSHRL